MPAGTAISRGDKRARGRAGAGSGAREDRVAQQVAEPPAALARGEEGGEADRAVLDDPRRRAQGDRLRGRGLAVAHQHAQPEQALAERAAPQRLAEEEVEETDRDERDREREAEAED